MLTFTGKLTVMLAATLVTAHDALDVWRFVGLRATGLRAVSLTTGCRARWQGIPGCQNPANGYEARNILGCRRRCQMCRWHWRWTNLYRSTTSVTAKGRAVIPRCPRGRRGNQRHRGGGAAGREPQLQRAGKLRVMMSRWYATRKQARRRGRINDPGSRQGVRASWPPTNHPDCLIGHKAK